MLKINRQLRRFSSNYQNKLLINNKWVDAKSEKTFKTLNPANEEVICKVAQAGKEDVDLAFDAANAAFKDFSKSSHAYRASLMNKLASLLEENKEELAALESLDNGKPIAFAAADVDSCAGSLRWFATQTTSFHGKSFNMDRAGGNLHAYTQKSPIGVCGSIVPWNYPLFMACFKLAPVLATGCTTILKPSEVTPLSALYLGELIVKAGIPEGVINILPGFGNEAGQAIVEHPGIRKISFTGSTATGKSIMRDSAETLKRVTLELGGKNPLVITEGADVEAAVQHSSFFAMINSGQLCISPSKVWVHESMYEEYCEKVVKAVEKMPMGPGHKEVMLGPLVSKDHMKRVLKHIQSGKKQGAKCLTGGQRMDRKGYFVEPTVFSDVTEDMVIAQEEIFGPVMTVSKYTEIEEVIQISNKSNYGLAAGIFGPEMDKQLKFTDEIQAGGVFANCYAAFQGPTPFGGFKHSGIGMEQGEEGLNAYLDTKTVILKY